MTHPGDRGPADQVGHLEEEREVATRYRVRQQLGQVQERLGEQAADADEVVLVTQLQLHGRLEGREEPPDK